MVSYKYLQYDVTDGYAEIVMDRPDILNAFHDEMIQELIHALTDAQSNDSVYAIVLTGAGRVLLQRCRREQHGRGRQRSARGGRTPVEGPECRPCPVSRRQADRCRP